MATSIDNESFRKLLLVWPKKAVPLLYEAYAQRLVRFSQKYTKDRKASEDIVHEIFAQVFLKHQELGQPNPEPIEGYLVKAVKYKSITFYRNKVRDRADRDSYLQDQAGSLIVSPAETHIIYSENVLIMRNILASFPRRERECFVLQVEEEMAVKDIASFLQISIKAVERSLTCARKRIKRIRPVLF